MQNTGPLTGHFPATAMPFRLGKTREDVHDGQPDVRRLHSDNLSFLKLSLSGANTEQWMESRESRQRSFGPQVAGRRPLLSAGVGSPHQSLACLTPLDGFQRRRGRKSSGPSKKVHRAFGCVECQCTPSIQRDSASLSRRGRVGSPSAY